MDREREDAEQAAHVMSLWHEWNEYRTLYQAGATFGELYEYRFGSPADREAIRQRLRASGHDPFPIESESPGDRAARNEREANDNGPDPPAV